MKPQFNVCIRIFNCLDIGKKFISSTQTIIHNTNHVTQSHCIQHVIFHKRKQQVCPYCV